ncbi:DoxX family protein [Spongiactinospora sp. 9N601]|uniref:DoxX family protein n=1 Tax=Spongiactinospora sp. 9N601 TaxID=3375149 RepID=UPI0037AFEA27
MDVQILFLRLVLSLVLGAHAAQKTFGWFQGPGLAGAKPIFARLGQVPAGPMVVLAAVLESVSALLLLIGLATPLACAIAAGTLLVAAASQTRLSGNWWNARGGGEYPLVLALLALGLSASGGGGFALDRALDAPWSEPSATESLVCLLLAAAVATLAAAGPVLRMLRFTSADRA